MTIEFKTIISRDRRFKFLIPADWVDTGAQKVQIGAFEAARYDKIIIDKDNDLFLIWYWPFGSRKDLFLCTFTALDNEIAALIYLTDFGTVEGILSSLEVMGK